MSLCQELFKLPGENTVNPVFLAIFGMLGVWPAVMAALLMPLRPKAQSLKAWPFVTASFGTHFSKVLCVVPLYGKYIWELTVQNLWP